MTGRNTLSLRAIEGKLLPEEATFQAQLRTAMFDGVTEADVCDVVKGIVAKAKAGDAHAQKMFFEYLLGHKNKPTQISIHNEFPDVESAARAEQLARRKQGA